LTAWGNSIVLPASSNTTIANFEDTTTIFQQGKIFGAVKYTIKEGLEREIDLVITFMNDGRLISFDVT